MPQKSVSTPFRHLKGVCDAGAGGLYLTRVTLSYSVVCNVGSGIGGCSYGAGPKSYGKDFNDAGTSHAPIAHIRRKLAY